MTLLILGLASRCNLPAGPGIPGASPVAAEPTAVYQVTQATSLPTMSGTSAAITPEATDTALALPARKAGTATPTLPPTDTPFPATETPAPPAPNLTPQVKIPPAAIQFLSPGPASKVGSPFLMRAFVPPGPDGIVRIELLGEDGRLLMREIREYGNARGFQVLMGLEVSFGISAVAEVGRLQISTQDEYGQVKTISSVDLILLSIGEGDFNPPGDLLENIVIQAPQPRETIQGGTAMVSGLARLRSDQPLMVELKAADGKILGTRQVAVTPSPGSTHGNFIVDVPYTVNSPTRARLYIWERGDPIPGVAQLSSLEVTLSP